MATVPGPWSEIGTATWELVTSISESRGLKIDAKCCFFGHLDVITVVALFIVGILAVAGVFNGPVVGWVAVGLGGAGLIGTILQSNGLDSVKKRKCQLIKAAIVAAVFISVGACGGMGLLSSAQVGTAILVTSLVGGCCLPCCFKDQVEVDEEKKAWLVNYLRKVVPAIHKLSQSL